MISPEEVVERAADRNITFDSEADRQRFRNELFNQETISKFIESSFNGNILYLEALD